MKYIFWITTLFITGSCSNIYNDAVNKTSEAGKLYQARMYLNQGNWDSAITYFNLLNPSTLSQPSVLVDRASAYSGRCGLNFLNFADKIQNMGSNNFMLTLLPLVNTASFTTVQDCITAESLLNSISTSCIVNDSLGQILAAFNSLAKISAILNLYADTDKDGAVDAGWDPCNPGGLADLSNADLDEIVTAFYIFMNNAAGLAVGSGVGASLLATCEAIVGVGNCNKCTVATVTNADRWLVRGMIAEDTDLLGLKIRPGTSTAVNAADVNCQL